MNNKRLVLIVLLFLVPSICAYTQGSGQQEHKLPEVRDPDLMSSSKVHGDIYGQPKVIDDFDGDGLKDIIFGATDGKIHLFSAKGHEIIRPPYWPKQTGGPILAEIQVADIDNNGGKEIIVASQDGKIYCLNPLGRENWVLDTRGKIPISAPEIADVDGNGKLNLFIGSESGKISRIDERGRLIWEIPMSDSVSGAIVAKDIDGDGVKEVICRDDSGKVMVLNGGGVPLEGWPKETRPSKGWSFNVDAGDINGDGTKEIFTTYNGKVVIWNTAGKKVVEVAPSDYVGNVPKLVDLDGDGKDEFVILQRGGKIAACDSNGAIKDGWPFQVNAGHCINDEPKVLDINGDGQLDIVFTVLDPKGKGVESGYVMAVSGDGKPITGYPKYVGKTLAPLTFADLDGNGYLEMIVAGGINYSCNQFNIFRTKARAQLKIAVLGQDITFK